MTSRDRVLAALNHQQSDKTPIDFGGHRSSGIAAMAYPKLRKAMGLAARPVRVYDPLQQLAIIDDDVLDRFQVDTIELGRGFAIEEDCWADWTLPDGTPCKMPIWALPERQDGQWVLRSSSGCLVAKMPDGAIYFEQCHWPFLEHDDLDKLPEALRDNMWGGVASPPGPLTSSLSKKYGCHAHACRGHVNSPENMPTASVGMAPEVEIPLFQQAASGPDGERVLAEGAKQLRRLTNRAIVGLFGGNLLELGQWLYRMDRFLMLLAGNPRRAHEFLERLVEIHLANLERYLRAVGPHIDIICFGDDLGMQNGPQMSRAMYQEFFKPRHAKMWRRAKELADVKVMLHCCGGVRPLLPDLIEAGLDVINPVQISCTGMDAAGLKRDFGDHITFWGGGCDTRFVLSHATPEEIRKHVREQVSLFNPGGGFVFQQVHNILADVPPENIVAMFDAANEIR